MTKEAAGIIVQTRGKRVYVLYPPELHKQLKVFAKLTRLALRKQKRRKRRKSKRTKRRALRF